MNQQINLYQPMFRRQKKLFSAKAMAQAVGVIALAMLSIWGFGVWQERKLAHDLYGIRAREAALIEQLTRLGAAPGGANPRQALADRVKALAEQRAAKRALLAELSGSANGPSGLAEFFAGLARQPVAGLWLTGIAVRRGGADVELYGRTARPEQVPRLVQKLGTEPAFQGKAFRTLRIFQPGRTTLAPQRAAVPAAAVEFEDPFRALRERIASARPAAAETDEDPYAGYAAFLLGTAVDKEPANPASEDGA